MKKIKLLTMSYTFKKINKFNEIKKYVYYIFTNGV